MPKQRLGNKPLDKKPSLDWIGEGREGEGAVPPEDSGLAISGDRKAKAERLSLTVDPELAAEFNKLCDMWRAAYPNTRKTDICNKMLGEFIAKFSHEIRKRLSRVLG